MDEARIEQDILRLLQNNGHKAYRPKEIARLLDYRDNRDYRLFREVLGRLEQEGRVARIKGGRYTYEKKSRQATGVLSLSPRGFGFVRLDDDGSELFVAPPNLLNALDGDRVEVRLLAPAREDRRREAKIERVVERRRRQTVGTFERYSSFGLVSSDDQRMLVDVRVSEQAYHGAESGDKVVVSIDMYDDPDDYPRGRILEVLGRSDEPGVAEMALAMSFGLSVRFEPDVVAEADQIALDLTEEELARREDFRSEIVFTIDPEDARDFDDAIHVRAMEDGTVEVGVHIADVSHYVRPGSRIDEEAYRRGTSVYLVDQVFPMLPERLSNEVCTLAPDADRLTTSCVMRLDTHAELVGYRIVESLIRSARRLTYEEAQRLLDGEAPDDPVADRVRRAGEIAARLTAKRLAAGSVDFDTPEVRVILDDRRHPVDIVRKHRLAAHRLIEEFMLLANRTVAGHVEGLTPEPGFVYRVHGRPDRDRIVALADYVKMFGMELKHQEGRVESQALNALLRRARGTPQELVVEEAVLRAMAKAHYTPQNSGHFGLGFGTYTHFTSPIRRYPDLMVHRLLKRYARGERWAKADAEKELGTSCERCSQMERQAEQVERESIKLKQVQFLQGRIGEQHRGIISGISSFGVFVELQAWLIEGLVHVRDMQDYYEYDERRFALVGSKGRTLQVGLEVEVVIADANPESRQVDFVFAPDTPY